eukprot:6020606-Lingulodinium_polyedra.AAC.1
MHEPWHAARARVGPMLEVFFADEAARATAKSEFEDYIAGSREFGKCAWPLFTPDDATARSVVLTWWQTWAPSRELRKLALHLHACRATSTQAECAWAFHSRQQPAIRTQLSAKTQATLAYVVANARYSKKVGAILDKLPAQPGPRALRMPTRACAGVANNPNEHDTASDGDDGAATASSD